MRPASVLDYRKFEQAMESFWLFYATAMQQGPDSIPFFAGKILVAGWFFFCLVILSTYTANLTAFLTANRFTTDINSINDLASQTEILYGTVRDSSIVDFLQTSTQSVHQRMYRFITTNDDTLVDNGEEAIRRVEHKTKGDYIFIWDEPFLGYVASNQPCKSQVIGKKFNAHAYGLDCRRKCLIRKTFH